MGKHKLATQDREKKFERKFKAFGQLNTFIDIKDYLKQMNTLNKPMGSLQSLPSIAKTKHLSKAESPRASEGSSASKVWNLNFSGRRSSKRTSSCDSDVGQILEGAKDYMAQYLAHQGTKINMTRKPVQNHRRTSTMTVNTLVNNEEHNHDYFYAAIDDLIMRESLEDLKQFRIHQDVVDFQKSKFRFQPSETKIDEKYYKNYKSRADKVIHLLGVASKKIYNKSLSQKPMRSTTKAFTEVKTPQNKTINTPRFEKFFSSGRFMDGVEAMDAIPSQNLANKFKRAQTKANTLIKQFEMTENEDSAGSSSSSLQSLNFCDRAKQEKKMNQQLNKIYNNLMNDIVNQAEIEEAHYKNLKYQFHNDICTLEQAYHASIDQILPRPLESIRKIDHNSTKIIKRSLKTKVSRKMITTALE